MIFKSFFIYFALVVLNVRGDPVDFTYDNLAGGWLKLHMAATRNDAATHCDSEDSVLVSPLNSQLRDAVKNYLAILGKSGLTIMSGVQADFSTGDYYSVEGVSLTRMPITIASGASGDESSSESCVKWMTDKAEVGIVKCSEILPFVCYKKRKTLEVVGCGVTDPAYTYDSRSGSCYKFHRVPKTWINAYKTCKKEKSYLAVINNHLENVVLNELFEKNPSNTISGSSDPDYAVMGFRDWLDGEGWKTVTGQTLADAGYDEWAPKEPNNDHGNEHCGSIYRKGKYNDLDCNYKFAFICEKRPEILYT